MKLQKLLNRILVNKHETTKRRLQEWLYAFQSDEIVYIHTRQNGWVKQGVMGRLVGSIVTPHIGLQLHLRTNYSVAIILDTVEDGRRRFNFKIPANALLGDNSIAWKGPHDESHHLTIKLATLISEEENRNDATQK